ncbi:MAG: DUF4843 domain-containing protein [Odoribacteraceae bacterium]|jgi:hypothetical protein|nr:DUF4843 domain-containing protein [Odoribacteraceae bacterium]
MKTVYLLPLLLLLLSCERELELYRSGDGLNFYRAMPGDTLLSYSFIYGDPDASRATVWLEVETIGMLSALPRAVELEQLPSGANDAVPGVHYLPFNDPAVVADYSVPAGQTRARLPLVLLRDASLQAGQVTILARVKPTALFPLVNPERNRVKIVFSDQLEKPENWISITYVFPFGEYGPVKHRFMIEQTGEKWDDEYFSETLGIVRDAPYYNANYDNAYCDYLLNLLARLLREYNAERQAAGLDVLKEADGTPVSF